MTRQWARCFGEILGDPFHEEAELQGYSETVIHVEDDVESENDGARGTANVQPNDLAVSDAEPIDAKQDEAGEGSSELLEQIFQASWDFEQETSRREV